MSATFHAQVAIGLCLIAAWVPRGVHAQVDQVTLAHAIRGDDSVDALRAFSQVRKVLAPEEMGDELRAALIFALERQNQVYRASAEAAKVREVSGRSSADFDRLDREFWGEGYGFLVETVIGFRDPEAIPALAGALFSANSLVVQPLVEFGEAAAPSVLDVAEGRAWHQSQIEGALTILAMMIREPSGGTLSAATIERARHLVQGQLTGGVSRTGLIIDSAFRQAASIRAAVSLALDLADPTLRALVADLSADPEAVRRLGIQDQELVEKVQQHASEALARTHIRR